MEAKEIQLYRNRFKKFYERYGHRYPREVIRYIDIYFESCLEEGLCSDILMQVYQELGVKRLIPSYYEVNANKITENFDIGCHIAEIGSGFLPALANIIASRQLKIGKGTITLFDPLLLPKRPIYKNMTIKREFFTRDTDISQFDLIISTLPCSLTEDIIETACRNHKDFYVAMCECNHLDDYIDIDIHDDDNEIYESFMIDRAVTHFIKHNNQKDKELYTDTLDDGYGMYAPIIYTKRR